MRTNEELELAHGLMRRYADRQRELLLEAGMTPLWDTDTQDYAMRTPLHALRRQLARVSVAHNIVDALEEGRPALDMLKRWSENLTDTEVYLHESGDAERFWTEYRMEVNFQRWLLGCDWPPYCQMFYNSRY